MLPVYHNALVVFHAHAEATSGNTINVATTLHNLTCKSCDKVQPELEVLAYYTEWYPNDGRSLTTRRQA
jgi:hypothetical protein